MNVRHLLLLTLLSACGDKQVGLDSGDTEDTDTTDGPECGQDDNCNDWEICEAEVCVDGDRNNAADEAESLIWDDGASSDRYINPAEDVDYYTISAAGGEYIRVRTISADDKGSGLYDTVVTLRDPNQKIIAQVDNYPTGAAFTSSDSSLYAYLPDEGTYTVEVEDNGSVDSTDKEEPYGDRSYTYTIQLDTWSAGTGESDAADDPSLSYEFTTGDTDAFWPMGVVLEEAGDVDYIDFSFPYDDARFLIYAQDDSYTDADPLVRIYDSNDLLVAEMSGIRDGGDKYTPALSTGDYRMEITDASGDGGDDHWFYLFLRYNDTGTTLDAEVEDNDDAFSATELETVLNDNSSGQYTFSGAMGYADDKKDGPDEDWYVVDAFDTGFMAVCLVSEYFGSAIAPTVSVFEVDGETVLKEVEGTDDYPTVGFTNVPVESGSSYYIRVAHDEGGATGLTSWYEFNAFIADFEIGSYGCPP